MRQRLALVLFAASAIWAVSLVAVPYAVSHQPDLPAFRLVVASVYLTGGFICHQRPERSFRPWDVQLPVCARCAGLYATAPLGAGLALAVGAGRLGRQRRTTRGQVRALLVITGFPTAATWSAEWLGLAGFPLAVRFAAALPLGAAVAWVVVTAVRDEPVPGNQVN